MKLNVCVHFIMPAIAFWKLQVAECLTFSCQAFSCWDNKCLSSFAHSGGCRLQTAGARWSLNTIPIRTPVLVAPLWLASLHARNLLLSNIYTQLERQMYHNFSDALPLHLESLCIFVCVFLGVLGEGVCFLTKKKGGGGGRLNYSGVKFSLHLFYPGVSGGGWCGWLQPLESLHRSFSDGRQVNAAEFLFHFFTRGWNADLPSELWQSKSRGVRRGDTGGRWRHVIHNRQTKRSMWFRLKHDEKKNDFF